LEGNERVSEIPSFLLGALQFQNARRETLRKVPDSEWQRVLSDWHVVRLTLPLRQVCGGEVPAWVCERIDVFLADNALRFERIKNVYSRAVKALEEAGTDHVVIKGFSLWPGYTDHPKYRPQSDIDLYCPPETASRARNALFALGYKAQPHWGQGSTEHLSTLIPPSSWSWRGNYFDPDIPVSLEIHFTWWDSINSRIHPQGLEGFWPRRLMRAVDGLSFPALDPADNLGYTALNLLRTVLHSRLAMEQAYGLARFLHMHADDSQFWERWRELHHDSLRRLESVSFLLARTCFGCRLSDRAQDEVNRLPQPIHQFFRYFSGSMLSAGFGSTKDGLWLHLDLLESRSDKWAILLRGMLPFRLVIPAAGALVDAETAFGTPDRKNHLPQVAYAGHKSIEFAKWFVARGIYHIVRLPARLSRGLAYHLSRKANIRESAN